ncbi:MAG: glutaredoxin family protein [Micrococcales bacterium]|nr:glutaredoxin family protein [Actinomycetota bacterium]NCA08114.1 glutaredoxin family protein [Micrococcales bacterium]
MSTTVDLTLIGKSGCHLCDEARVTVNAVVGAFRAEYTGVARHIQVNLVEHDILVDEELWNKYSEEVPVLLINGKIHNYWRIDPVRLRGALEEFVR